jgi:Fic family protein
MPEDKTDLQKLIIGYIQEHPQCSSQEIRTGLQLTISIATLKRILQKMVAENLIAVTGKLKGTKYEISPAFGILRPIDLNQYYEKEIDERIIQTNFNHSLIGGTLGTVSLFTDDEQKHLIGLQEKFHTNTSRLSSSEYARELNRLAIDLSWKSSQIEGNTYSLLETERLLNDKETAAGKTKDEATMLLNHKEAIDFIVANPKYINPLTIATIEDIHSILIKDLDIERNLRKRRVGISGTNYKPLDNSFQIKEALGETCNLINTKKNVFEKALLSLILISYIQPFSDGNKRTARIISNAVLINHHYCPLSFRTIDSLEYKKAMLVFYEQNNIYPFKQIFIDQFEFAVNTYF